MLKVYKYPFCLFSVWIMWSLKRVPLSLFSFMCLPFNWCFCLLVYWTLYLPLFLSVRASCVVPGGLKPFLPLPPGVRSAPLHRSQAPHVYQLERLTFFSFFLQNFSLSTLYIFKICSLNLKMTDYKGAFSHSAGVIFLQKLCSFSILLKVRYLFI